MLKKKTRRKFRRKAKPAKHLPLDEQRCLDDIGLIDRVAGWEDMENLEGTEFNRSFDQDGNPVAYRFIGEIRGRFRYQLTSAREDGRVKYYFEAHPFDGSPPRTFSILQGSHPLSRALESVFAKTARFQEMLNRQLVGEEGPFSVDLEKVRGKNLD